jgi:voltage-gated potassium channel Kch
VALLVRVPGVFGVLYPLRAGHRVSLLTTINLSQVSEFSLVILTLGAGFGHIGRESVTTAIWVFSILAVLSTYLVNYSHRLQAAGARLLVSAGVRDIGRKEERALHGAAKPVALLGFYRAASAMVAELAEQAPETLAHLKVVDFNPVVKKKLDSMGVACVYGDISHPDTLKHAHLEETRVFICTLPDHILKGSSNLRLLKNLRAMFPSAAFVMTAENPSAAAALYGAGADYVLQPSALAGAEAAKIAEHALDGSLAARRDEALAALAVRKEILH